MFVGMKNRYPCLLGLKHSRLLVIQVGILGFDAALALDATVFQTIHQLTKNPRQLSPVYFIDYEEEWRHSIGYQLGCV